MQRVAEFSRGFYKLGVEDSAVLVTDLRMGQEPYYSFAFAVARRHSAPEPLAVPRRVGARPDLARALPWLWRRMWGEALPSPR